MDSSNLKHFNIKSEPVEEENESSLSMDLPENVENSNYSNSKNYASLPGPSFGNNMKPENLKLEIKCEPMDEDSKPPKFVNYGKNWLRYEAKEERIGNFCDSSPQDNLNMAAGESSDQNNCSDHLLPTSGLDPQTRRSFEEDSKHASNNNSKCTKASQLRNHLEVASPNKKSHLCAVCGKSFFQTFALNKHLKIHTGEKPHHCNVCEKNFREYFNFKVHLKTHTGKKPYQCLVCDKKFTRSSNLKSHSKIHTGIKPHHCNVCEKSFREYFHFKVHLRMHTGERPYQCLVCDKKFTHSSNLKSHSKIHTGDKPH